MIIFFLLLLCATLTLPLWQTVSAPSFTKAAQNRSPAVAAFPRPVSHGAKPNSLLRYERATQGFL